MLCELLGLESVPSIDVFADPRFDQGRHLHPGRQLDAADLESETIGGLMSTDFFEFRLGQSGDKAWFLVAEGESDDEDVVEAVFSPTRTCVGVVLATALSLAAAHHGRGEFLDREIGMLEPDESDPEAVLARTKLTEPGSDFAAQCERYMRQFTRLNGWPAGVL